MNRFAESTVEDAALEWLEGLGYSVLGGPKLAFGEPTAERTDPNYRDVILERRLRVALVQLNPDLPPEAIEYAFRKLTRADAPSLVTRNHALHRMLVDGVEVEFTRTDGSIGGAQAKVLDFDTPENNDWLAVNQFTVAEGQHTRRPDVIIFINGLPLAVIELKNPADENATIWTNASFIGFTGTPIEKTDANTRRVFGISVYDIQRAVEDKATVPIYYESRLAKLGLNEEHRPKIDEEFEEATESEEVERRERFKSKWAALEAVVGTEKRLRLVAEDLVKHFEQRLEAMDGKAMIVCMSRRICVDLYKELIKVRPHWHGEDDSAGRLKVVMTGSAADGPEWQQHIRVKSRREALAQRFKDPKDGFQIVIVRDMWLTGFDVPCLHTMYVDKYMRSHGLMQAIARVNRVFKDKPGGLVVDYLGIAPELQRAVATYTESGGKGSTAEPQEKAVGAMLAKYEVCCGLFHGFNWSKWISGTATERLALLPNAQEHILKQKDGKERLMKAVTDLSSAFALAVPHEEAMRITDDVGFFQAVRAVLAKSATQQHRPDADLDHVIRQIVSKAVFSEGVIDIFAAAGLKKPDISILSDDFLAEVSRLPQKNLAVELLRKLLSEEIKTRSRRNVVQSHRFSELLLSSIAKYQNRAIEAAQVIEELIAVYTAPRSADL